MPQIERAGFYIGKIKNCKVDRTKNGAMQFVASLEATRFKAGKDANWIDLEVPRHITAYLSLTTLQSEKNATQIESLMEALDWDGQSLRPLHHDPKNGYHSPLIDRDVNFTVKDKPYQGKSSLRVAWLDKVGGLKEVPLETFDLMERQFKGMQDAAVNAQEVNEPTPY